MEGPTWRGSILERVEGRRGCRVCKEVVGIYLCALCPRLALFSKGYGVLRRRRRGEDRRGGGEERRGEDRR